MRTFALAVALLALGSAFVLVAPQAEAAQFCTSWKQSWCPGFFCVWDHLNGGWYCPIGGVYCVTEPCWYAALP